MASREAIMRALDNVAHHGSASGEQATGPALAKIIRAAIKDDDDAKANTDLRSICIGTMKNMQYAMEMLRRDLDTIEYRERILRQKNG